MLYLTQRTLSSFRLFLHYFNLQGSKVDIGTGLIDREICYDDTVHFLVAVINCHALLQYAI